MTNSIDADRLEWDPKPERLIAVVRLGLAVGGLLVIWFDPTLPSKAWPVAYVVFILYVVYSAVILQVVRRRPYRWLAFATQAVDLVWIVPVVYFTEAGQHAVFLLFRDRHSGRGHPVGAEGVLDRLSLQPCRVHDLALRRDTDTARPNYDLMRIGYLFVVGVLGGYLTA